MKPSVKIINLFMTIVSITIKKPQMQLRKRLLFTTTYIGGTRSIVLRGRPTHHTKAHDVAAPARIVVTANGCPA